MLCVGIRPVDVIVGQPRLVALADRQVFARQVILHFVADPLTLEQVSALIRQRRLVLCLRIDLLERQRFRNIHIAIQADLADTRLRVLLAGEPHAHIAAGYRRLQRMELRQLGILGVVVADDPVFLPEQVGSRHRRIEFIETHKTVVSFVSARACHQHMRQRCIAHQLEGSAAPAADARNFFAGNGVRLIGAYHDAALAVLIGIRLGGDAIDLAIGQAAPPTGATC